MDSASVTQAELPVAEKKIDLKTGEWISNNVHLWCTGFSHFYIKVSVDGNTDIMLTTTVTW